MTDQYDLLAQSLAGTDAKARQLYGAVNAGLDFNPDDYARSMRHASALGVQPSAVLNDPKTFDHAVKLQAINPDALVNTHPRTATFLSNLDNAAVAHDDLPVFRRLEEGITGNRMGLTPSQYDSVLADRAFVASHNITRTEGGSLLSGVNSVLSAPGALGMKVLGSLMAFPEAGFRALGDLTWNYHNESLKSTAKRVLSEYTHAGGEGTLSGDIYGTAGKAQALVAAPQKIGPSELLMDPVTGRTFENPDWRTVDNPVIGRVVNPLLTRQTMNTVAGLPGVALEAYAMGPAALGMFSADAGSGKAEEARREIQAQHPERPLSIMEEATALAEGYGSAVANYYLMSKVPPAVQSSTVAGAVARGATRATLLSTMLTATENDLARLHDPERPLLQGETQNLVAFAGLDLFPVLRHVVEIRNTQNMLQLIHEATSESKLAERAPGKYEEALGTFTKGTGQETTYIDAQRFVTFFQDKGMDPGTVAQDLGAKNLSEAVAAGTDLEFPTSRLAARLVKSGDFAALSPDMKFSPEFLSQREFNEEVQKLTSEANHAQAAAELEALPMPEVERFQGMRQAQLEAAGFTPDTAKDLASWHARVFDTLASGEGLTVDQMNTMFPLDVSAYRVGEDSRSLTDRVLARLQSAGENVRDFFQRGDGRYATAAEKRSARMRRLALSSSAAMDKARTQAHEAEEAEFATFDNAVKEIQAGDVMGDKRGFIRVGDRQFHIGLLEKRDLSTFLHESGHFFLEVMGDLAERSEASERIRSMWADTLKQLGVESRDKIGTDQHETFARWTERYLMEGKAPSETMRPLMQRFKGWLMLVYDRLANKLGVRMNDDVRSVFDRLMATDREIEAQKSQVPQMFTTPEDMGVTPEEFKIYREAIRSVPEDAKDSVTAAILQRLKVEKSAERGEQREAIRREVLAGIESRQDVRSFDTLKDPEAEIKLDRRATEEQFGKETAKGLPLVDEGGMDAETAAMALGYDSGAELIRSLKNSPNKEALADRLTEEIMLARHGDWMLDGSLAGMALDALHNESKGLVMALEMKALNRLRNVTERVVRARDRQDRSAQREADQILPSLQQTRLAARAFIADMNLRAMNANKFRLAEEKASRESYELKGKRQYAEAAAAKRREMLNHYLFLEAQKGRIEGEKIATMAREGSRGPLQAILGKAGQGFQDAYNEILGKYEFIKVSGIQLDERRASLQDLQKAHEDAGIDIDPAILAQFPRNYREIPLTELRAVRDALANIEHVAREMNQVLMADKKADLEEVSSKLVERAVRVNGSNPLRQSGSDIGYLEKRSKGLKGLDAYHKQMVRIIDALDGRDPNGPWHQAIWQPISDAMGREQELSSAILKRVQEIVEKRGDLTKKYLDTSIGVKLPGEAYDLNRRQAITFLLNLGTEENRNAMLGGFRLIMPDGSLSPIVHEIVGKLSRAEVEFAQDIWDTLGTLWPAIEEQERRLKGIVPTKKTETPFAVTTRDGEEVLLRGGYFPLVGEPLDRTGKRQMSGDLSRILEAGYTPATTSRSHTKEVTGATYRVNLDFGEVLSKHIPSVIKDITHREAVLSINRLLSQPEVTRIIQETIGPEYEEEFLPWLKSTVNNRNVGPQEGGKVVQWLLKRRQGMVAAQLGFNFSSTVVQATDLFKVWNEVPAKNIARAYLALTQNPKETVGMIRELSPNRMRHFEENYHRDLMQWLESKDVFEQAKGKVTEKAMLGFKIMGQVTAFPAWLGTYQRSMETHGDQAQAVREADLIVDRVIQMGNPTNLSRVMREKGVMNLFTTFQGDQNVWYNIISSTVGERSAPRFTKALMSYFIAGIAGNLIVGRGPRKDESWPEWIIEKSLIGVPELVPITGDLAKMGLSTLRGQDWKSQQYSAVFNAVLKPFVAGREIGKEVTEGNNAADAAFATVDAVGTWEGFSGTSQALKSGKYLYRVNEGEEQPQDPGDVAMGVLFGKRRQ